jgi:hypothetical protein
MPDETISPAASVSIEEQSDILANLALAQKIFNTSLAQQNVILNQQIIFQIELAALAKCIQVLLAAETTEPEAIEQLTTRMTEMFNQLHSKVEERITANEKQISELMDEIKAHAKQ